MAISDENRSFSHPVYFAPPLKGLSPWNWVPAIGVKN